LINMKVYLFTDSTGRPLPLCFETHPDYDYIYG
jgi:hypothetical protein